MKKRALKIFLVVNLLFCITLITNVSYGEIFSLPENFIVSYDDIKRINREKTFGGIVNSSVYTDTKETMSGENEEYIVFKAFGFIPIRKIKVKVIDQEEVYIGGIPIGIEMNTDGVVVEEGGDILKKGDQILKINDDNIEKIDFDKLKNENELLVKRNNKEKIIIIKKDDVKIKTNNQVSGIGTLTYVKQDNQFGALGHGISENKNIINASSGKIYKSNLLGIEKGEKNKPGQIKCVFVQNSGEQGKLALNCKFGVFGELNENHSLVDKNLKAKIGGRLGVKTGRATIVSSISGIREEYEIEIIKANYQGKENDKSLTFRVVDERLIDLTGGIIQGMSGSPIMQDGKIIGAVTHVFTSDPKMGYGVYIDWMMLNCV